jgi:hypothetical protein
VTLEQLEAWFWNGVRGEDPPPDLDRVICGPRRLPAERRLGIYHSAYFARQLNVLSETFEKTRERLGDERFRRIAIGYLRACPSRAPAIERVGDRFPDFLAGLRDDERPPSRVVDLSRLEWTRLEALLAEDPGAELDFSAWVSGTLGHGRARLAPQVKLCEVERAALALFEGGDAPDDGREDRVTVAAFRRGFGVVHLALSPEETEALSRASSGASFDDVCECFEEPGGVDRAAMAVTRWLRSRWLIAVGALSMLPSISGCADDPAPRFDFEVGPTMKPGDDCLRCHSAGSDFPTAPHWSAAGTVFPSSSAATSDGVPGVAVELSEPDGTPIVRLLTNSVGNFYTGRTLPEGFRVALEYQGERVEMPCPPPAGNCGACHFLPPLGEAPGRIFLPGGGDPVEPPLDCDTWTRPTP